MKRVVKMNVVLTGWLALAIIMGVSSSSLAETESHESGKAKTAETGTTARPKAAAVPLPAEYDQLLAALAKVDSRGLKVKDSVKIDAKGGETVEVSIADVVKLRNWVGTFKTYREMLTTCAVKSDKSADLFGKFLDEFVAKLQASITDDPKNASGLKEKELVTYVSQMEKFLKEKANLFSSSKADFEKADETLLKQLKETVGVFFTGYHESQFDAVRQAADADTKAIAEKMTEAVGALAFRERNDGAVCKLAEEKAGEEKAANEEGKEKEDSEDSEKEEAKDESGKEDEKGKRAALDKPGPLEGDTPPGEQGGEQQQAGDQQQGGVGQQAGDQQQGGLGQQQGVVDDGGNIPVVDDGNIPFFDPGFNNGNQDVVDDFNADALLQGLLDRFKDLEDQARDQQRLADQQIQDALAAAQRLADDIARQNQAALDAQKNEDNGLADALKALQPPPPPQPPVIPPPPPPAIPPISGSGEGDRGATPFLPPQPQEEPLPPQGGGMPYPPFMPQQPSSPPIIIGEEKSRFEDDYYQRRASAIVPPQQNPQAAGLLELVRLQQQLMFAQQQATQQPQVGVGVNVNSIANRLATSGARTSNRQLPTRANQASTNKSTQGSTSKGGSAPGARSGTVPAAIRGSLAR